MKTRHLPPAWPAGRFFIGSLALSLSWWVWSFTQTDPNLYYSSISSWVRFQQFMWQTPRPFVVGWYLVMILTAFILYMSFLRRQESSQKNIPIIPGSRIRLLVAAFTGMTMVLLVTSNNALSHDIYNYMFNAKAVAIYHQDPHFSSALEIAPQDDWVRFMHNVHTTAPYGHMWTYFSLVPYFAGLGKFVTTYLSFKVCMAVGVGLLAFVQSKMLKDQSRILLFILNPLVLIETLSNGHNDVWMMVLALGSFALLFKAKKVFSWQTLVSLSLLVLSTQIKEATLVLIPLWGAVLSFSRKRESSVFAVDSGSPISTSLRDLASRMTSQYWAEIAVVFLFIPLLTSRSQQFNPWYLIWPLTFLPFVTVRMVKHLLVIFSLTSLVRYVPFLFVGGYSDAIQWQMRLITWSAIPITLLVYFCHPGLTRIISKRFRTGLPTGQAGRNDEH